MHDVVILSATEHNDWQSWLDRSYRYDFYHLPSYHLMSELNGEGEAKLLVYSCETHFVAIPILLRPIREIDGLDLDIDGMAWCDVSSVYGYAGPVFSHEQMPKEIRRSSHEALTDTLRDLKVVSVFSRLHPLIGQEAFLSGLGEIQWLGDTVSVDLTLSPQEQRTRYRKDHKYGVNKLVRAGVIVEEDTDWTYLDEFIRIYHDNMERVDAQEYYLFDKSYFLNLRKYLGRRLHLFHCWLEGRIVCSGLFVLCNGIVQYHLSGTNSNDLDLSPMRLLIDGVRRWATMREAEVFFLGGGLGAQSDSLFDFKAGFSDRRHAFALWKWILYPHVYQKLVEAKEQHDLSKGKSLISPSYFPEYRAPMK